MTDNEAIKRIKYRLDRADAANHHMEAKLSVISAITVAALGFTFQQLNKSDWYSLPIVLHAIALLVFLIALTPRVKNTNKSSKKEWFWGSNECKTPKEITEALRTSECTDELADQYNAVSALLQTKLKLIKTGNAIFLIAILWSAVVRLFIQ